MGAVSGMLGLGGGASGSGFSTPSGAAVSPQELNQTYNQSQQGLLYQNNLLNALMGQNGIQNQSQVFGQTQQVANGQGPNPAQAMLNQATAQNTTNQAALMAGQRGASSNVGLIARQAAQQGAANQQQAALGSATMQAQQQLAALGQLQGMAGQEVGQQQAATGAYTAAAQGQYGQLLNAQVQGQNSVNSANATLANTSMGQQASMLGNLTGGLGSASSLLKFAQGGEISKPSRKMYAQGDSVYQDIPAGYDPFANTSASLTNNPQIGVNQTSANNLQSFTNLIKPSQSIAQPSAAIISQMAPASPQQPVQVTGKSAGPQSNFGKRLAANMDAQKNAKDPISQGNAGAAVTGTVLGGAISKGLNSLFGSSSSASNDPANQQNVNDLMFNANRPDQMEADQSLSNAAQSDTSSSPADISQMAANGGILSDYKKANLAQVFLARGGKVPALLSPGEQYLPPKDVKKVVKDGKNPLEVGKQVKGKPKHPGNDYRNDTVKATLKEGGIVIPNSVMQSKNPPLEAMKFVQATMAKSKHKK